MRAPDVLALDPAVPATSVIQHNYTLSIVGLYCHMIVGNRVEIVDNTAQRD